MSKKFSNLHLVEFCEKFIGHPYWYATCVYNCTQDMYNRKKNQYPAHYGSDRTSKYQSHIAAKEICADCVGLIKGYMWTNGGEGVFEAAGTGKKIINKYQSNNCPDKSANGMFSYAKSKGMEWGAINSIPEIPGVAVRFDGHVGVYIGNGYVIEEKGFKYGCQKTLLKNGKWTHWYKLPFITYQTDGQVVPEKEVEQKIQLGSRLLKKGTKGEDVIELQTLLSQLGFLKDKIDGDFGTKTEEAVKNFQRANNLTADGKYGEKSHKALMEAIGDDEPDFEDEPIISAPENQPAETKQNELEVTADSVRIRKGNSTKYGILTTVHKGNKLIPILDLNNKPLRAANGWYAVDHGENIGWISGNYIKEL